MAASDYDKLRSILAENKKWPMRYMFKFIVPNEEGKVDKVVAGLPKDGKTTFKHTKNLKHVAVTCVASMASADDIIYISDQIAEIPGVMAL